MKMRFVIFCQALLITTLTLTTSAQPTSSHLMPMPNISQLDLSDMELLPTSDEDSKEYENPDLFEGDIVISPEEIEHYYGKQTNTQNRIARGVRRDIDYHWPNGIIFYDFDPSIENSSHRIIKYAMGTIEEETCLKFQFRTFGNRIQFTNGSGCSSSVGMLSIGKQAVTLSKGCLKNVGIIMHEILHALGLWHEQNRPDRDNYVRVIKENIKDGHEHNFQKRNSFEVDYHGEGYDYGSIMHYRLSAFKKRPGLNTMEVSNDAEYVWQGRPNIGQIKALSTSDITQINRMYNCPGSGVPGTLRVLIKNATNVIADANESYYGVLVEVIAVDDRELSVVEYTLNVSLNYISTWNELLDFGGRISWQYITISIWTESTKFIHPITWEQTFSLSSGSHRNLRHCSHSNCYTTLYFDYELKLDRDECNPNPCKNNGTCHDLISNFMCYCPAGYSGPKCQHAKGRLEIFVRNATDLPKRPNGDFASPFVSVYAYTRNKPGVPRIINTNPAKQVQSPQWNFTLDFGVEEWSKFNIRIIDYHMNTSPVKGTPLSKWTSYYLNSHTSEMFVKMEAYNGYMLFDYHFEIFVEP